MRLTPLLIVVTLLALLPWNVEAADDHEGFKASAIMEPTTTGRSIESTAEGPALEMLLASAGSFDVSMLIVLVLGLIGLVWIRRHVRLL